MKAKLWCRLAGHRWREHRDSGVYVYAQCARCGDRRARQYRSGYQPLDWDWLKGA